MHYVESIKRREPTPILVSSLSVTSSSSESTERRLKRIDHGAGEEEEEEEEEEEVEKEEGGNDEKEKTQGKGAGAGDEAESDHLRAAARRTALRERLQRLQKARRRAEAQGIRVDHNYAACRVTEDNLDYAVRCAPLEVCAVWL